MGASDGEGSERMPSVRRDPGTATIRDVARLAGVAVGTVSKVMNRPDRCRSESRARVLEAAARLNFNPNAMARRLSMGMSRMLAYCYGPGMSPLPTPFGSMLVRALVDEASNAGYNVVFIQASRGTGGRLKVPELVLSRGVDGLLLHGADRELIETLSSTKAPLVTIDGHGANPGVISVDNDDYGGTCLGVRHLASLGYTRIGFLGWPLKEGDEFARLTFEGFRDTMVAAGMEANLRYAILERDLGSMVVQALDLLQGSHPPEAFFCSGDEVACGLIGACLRKGITVPGDLAVVGMDDLDVSRYIIPSLTTVKIHAEDMARQAVRMLIEVVAGSYSGPAKVTWRNSMVVRESCRRVAAGAVGLGRNERL